MKSALLVVLFIIATFVMAGSQIASADSGDNTVIGSGTIVDGNKNRVDIGTTTVNGGIKNTNNNTNTNVDVNTNLNVNTNKQGQQQGQQQGQLQGQLQGQAQINEGNKVSITNEKPLLGYNTAYTPDLSFGHGVMDWKFANALPKVGIPIYSDREIIKEVVDTTANVPVKKLLPTLLKMKKDQMPLCYNVRLIIVRAGGQKTWNSGGSLSGGSAGSFASGGASAGASLIPSVGGTKAHDLFTIIIVKVTN